MTSLDERGQVFAIVVVMALGLLAIAGLVIDGGLVFAAKRDLQATADAAARAGASVIDEALYRRSKGRRSLLDPEGAEAASRSHLRDARAEEVRATPLSVRVKVGRKQELLLLGVVGLGPVQVEATSTARPRTGIGSPEE